MSSFTITLPTQLGFLKEDGGGLLVREETSDFNDWDGGLAGGSAPCWLFPPNANGETDHKCKKCGNLLCFLVQIYAPLNEVDDAFHRDLCLFICQQCQLAECIRMQMSEENDIYDDFDDVPQREAWSANWPCCAEPLSVKKIALVVEEEEKNVESSESEDDDDEEEEEEEDRIHHCAVCNKQCEERCSQCKQVYYCSVEHQREDWKPNHKRVCASLADATMTQRDLDKTAAAGDVKRFDQLSAGKDREFTRFTRKTRNEPDQVLRYQRADNVELWISKKNKLTTAPPQCEYCQAERQFEFQLLPQFLSFFPEAPQSIDFGTICVYTCTKSCGGSKAQRAEYAYLQPEEQV